jgi:hypothetical protein
MIFVIYTVPCRPGRGKADKIRQDLMSSFPNTAHFHNPLQNVQPLDIRRQDLTP